MDTLYPGEFGVYVLVQECLEEAWKRPGEQYSRGKLASSPLENLQSLLFRRAGSIAPPLDTRPTAEGWSWALGRDRNA